MIPIRQEREVAGFLNKKNWKIDFVTLIRRKNAKNSHVSLQSITVSSNSYGFTDEDEKNRKPIFLKIKDISSH